MVKIGFGTGNLRELNLSLKEIITLYLKTGAEAIELSTGSYDGLINLQLDDEMIRDLNNFTYISFHLPSIFYGNNMETNLVFRKLRELAEKIPLKAAVIHPDKIEDFSILEKTGFPLLIENMDKRHKEFINPEQFLDFKKKHNFGFVLDLQHAYEHDPSMGLCRELIRIMGSRLKEMHVSGFKGDLKHAPVHLSENKSEIEGVLKSKIDVPIILEGAIFESTEETAKKEMRFIKEVLFSPSNKQPNGYF